MYFFSGWRKYLLKGLKIELSQVHCTNYFFILEVLLFETVINIVVWGNIRSFIKKAENLLTGCLNTPSVNVTREIGCLKRKHFFLFATVLYENSYKFGWWCHSRGVSSKRQRVYVVNSKSISEFRTLHYYKISLSTFYESKFI